MGKPRREPGHGPFRADQVREGDRYELSEGHAIYCAPTGGDGAKRVGTGFGVIDSDPAVESAGVDPGYTPTRDTLRAPDIAIGVPDAPGWIPGAPPFAVEFAGSGEDESDLRVKIEELLRTGTQLVWVVRLMGPRRVEIHEPGKPVRLARPGDTLTAPGLLKNPIPVSALYDRDEAHELILRNLLQRHGYADLQAVRDEGRDEGREVGELSGVRHALIMVLEGRGLTLPGEVRERIEACHDRAVLDRWLSRAGLVRDASELLP